MGHRRGAVYCSPLIFQLACRIRFLRRVHSESRHTAEVLEDEHVGNLENNYSYQYADQRPYGHLREGVYIGFQPALCHDPVSYTHLDVYKRQTLYFGFP